MVKIKLPSGFTVEVKMLGPYALDPLRLKYKDPSPVMRQVKLLAGDVDYWPYIPPNDVPDKNDEPEEYELYMRWLACEVEKQRLQEEFARARRDFLLMNCVSVVDGPISMDDDGWLQDLLVVGLDAPTTEGERKLLFLKTQVIRTISGYEEIVKNALAQEVSLEDVLQAMDNMDIEWDGMRMRDAIKLLPTGRARHSTRVWEIRAADSVGMSLEQWYSLPLYERALRVATLLAPEWLAALEAERVRSTRT